MTQNIYDDPAFFEGYSRLNRSIHGLDGAPNGRARAAARPARPQRARPRLRLRLVQPLGGRSGRGKRARHRCLRAQLERAASTAAHPAITYRRADLETLALPNAAFDLAYSSLAFHYVAHLDTLLRTIHRALVPGGRLVFSIEHPIYTAPRQPGFVVDAQGNRACRSTATSVKANA